ncbi:MAG: sigma-70 family RNA polymerase sigma factor [Planctomycetes bacterium]|nr:sigma-70 family RNA polymerase sigma factor [Planctomycetota bacterium]
MDFRPLDTDHAPATDHQLGDSTSSNGDRNAEHREIDASFHRYRRTHAVEDAARFHRLTFRRVRLLAAGLIRDPNDVDEVVQETYLAAFQDTDGWDGARPVLPWLYGIARHRALNLRRSRGRRRVREASVFAEHGSAVDAAVEAGAAEVVRVVEHTIAGLPRLYREVVARNVLSGDSSAEIARGLGRAESTVRVQLSRGLRMLRRSLPAGISAALAAALLPDRGFAAAWPSPAGDVAREAARDAAIRRATLRSARRMTVLAATAAMPLLAILVGFGPGQEVPETKTTASAGLRDAIRDATVALPLDPVVVREPAPAPVTTELVVELVHEGKPVAGVPIGIELVKPGVFVTAVRDRFGSREIFELPEFRATRPAIHTTDEQGAVRCTVRPGHHVLTVPGQSFGIVTYADTPGFVRHDLTDRAALVTGVVVDADGQPHAAELWCSSDAESPVIERRLVTPDGRFAMLVARGATVVARSGVTCSTPRRADASGDFPIVLVPSGEVSGVLVTDTGRPVAHGVVDVTSAGSTARVKAAADGTWRLAGVTAGACVVSGRSTTSGMTRLDCEVRVGEATHVELVLRTGANVSGRVTDAYGRGVGRTRVAAGWSFTELGWCATATDENGFFRLDGIGPGAVRLTAGLGPDGLTRASFTVEPDESLVWNPVISHEDVRVRGRVVAPHDAGELVVAIDSVDHFAPQTQTLTDGRFVFDIPEPATTRSFTLRIYPAAAFAELGVRRCLPIATFTGLRPGLDERVFVVDANPSPRGVLTARLDASVADQLGRVRLLHEGFDHWIVVGSLTAERRVLDLRLDRLPAGDYALLLDGNAGRHEFTLADGASLDLGTVRFATGASPTASCEITLVFEHPNDVTPMGRLQCEVLGDDGTCLSRFGIPGSLGAWRHTLRLPSGNARVIARTSDGLAADQALAIGAEPALCARIPLRAPVAQR